MGIFTSLLYAIIGTKQQRDIKKLRPFVEKVNAFEPVISTLSNDALAHKTEEFKQRLAGGETLDDILPEAYAVVREVAKRTLNMRHFDVQIMGGVVLHQGKIAEMKTGEGKTLVATLPLYLNALTGKGAHLVTVNDYLARRDAVWMGPIYRFLGLSVGIINHEKSYYVDWEDISQYKTTYRECSRQEAYRCDITYGTNNEFGFDYLRDNMVFAREQKVQRGHYYAIVDEVDSILIDEARTPLIISGPTEETTDLYYRVDKIVPRLTEAQVNEKNEPIEGTGDYAVDEKDKTVVLTEQGIEKIEQLLGIKELYSPKNSKLVHHIIQAIRAHRLYHRDVDYVVENGEVVIVDEFTGRKMPGRRWSDGLHQAIEAKERVSIRQEFQTLATITFQNYFRMYEKLAGMTGTAETEAQEFYSIYHLDVVVIPPNVPVQRIDAPDKIYINENAKFKAIVRDVEEHHKKGQPILIGTISVEKSERLSKLLQQRRIPHNVLNAKYHEKEAEIIAQAGQAYAVTIATNMAGRGTDIKLAPGVKELGGLLVIGSERHESRRIDNQLRGRSGRQGDPGYSQFYVSLEDDLMRLFGMDSRIQMMKSLGFSEDEEIQSKLISNAIENAQKRVENRNFEIRKHLLEYDNVMNEQRTYIYRLRDEILDIHHHPEVIDTIIDRVIEDKVSTFSQPTRPHMWPKDELEKWLKLQFMVDLGQWQPADYNTTKQTLTRLIKTRVWDRFQGIPEQVRYDAIKYVLLSTLDARWKEHLRAIDYIQESIGLRQYASKNPIVEYKVEAFDLFARMRSNFMADALAMLAHLEIQMQVAEELPVETGPQRIEAQHTEFGQFGTMKAASPMEKPKPVQRGQKLGRNDPCWCGSGKKYKYCHYDADHRQQRV
ncbi:preprotein translocase subunit SecA [Thermospira aquatica]|uniref:Protein translocase subunit SecA n=1 Tax=Thermospira aquatica TaxID=2828656 RepID=A0AAX3BBK4_9SPIR|nr:preprotein translocase subunit SecA [Thermospira aquatica]URA09468.1 preprotein translocase subunit SecA [Thermospira aquatica]